MLAHRVLALYTGALTAAAGVGLLYAIALALLHVSQWMEAHPARARAVGWGYSLVRPRRLMQVHLSLVLPALGMTGHLSWSAGLLCLISTMYSAISMAQSRWPLQRPAAVWRWTLGLGAPLAAHAALTRLYRDAQHAWLLHDHGLHAHAPALPNVAPWQVVALIAGLVWVLPVYQWVSETTQAWSLPS